MKNYGRLQISKQQKSKSDCVTARIKVRPYTFPPGMTHAVNCEQFQTGYLKLVCLLSTSAYGALEVLHIMRYMNLLTYLLTVCTSVRYSK